MAELKYKDITEKIIGASFEVHKFLGNACRTGFSESNLKAHGGEKVETDEGRGTSFIIHLLHE